MIRLNQHLRTYRRARPRNIRLTQEESLQYTCVTEFRMKHPDKTLFHVPNGGLRDKTTAIKFKMIGAMAGVWDLFLMEPLGGYLGLWLEAKIIYADGRKNPLSDKQKIFGEIVRSKGYKTGVFYTVDEFWDHVNDYLSLEKRAGV